MFGVDQIQVLQRPTDIARAALHWWLGELTGLVPMALRRRLGSLQSRLLLIVDGTDAQLAIDNGDRRELLGRLDLANTTASGVRRLVGVSGASSITISLPAARALRTTATLPLAAERNLDQVVGFEFERLVPFKRDDVYFAYRIAERRKNARTLQVELTVLPKADVAAALSFAERADLAVDGIDIAAARPGGTSSFIPLRRSRAASASPRLRWAFIGLAVLLPVLVLACIVIPFARAENTEADLAAAVAEARSHARASLALQKQIDAETTDREFLVARKQATPTVTELLDIVTRLAPDDTYLTELQIEASEIHMVGAAASATALLGLIDQSSIFRNAAFRSSITQDTAAGRERFDIAAQIVPRTGK